MFENQEKTAMSTAIFCLVFGSLYQSLHEQSQHGWQKYQVQHKPTFFCCSLVKSRPICLDSKALTFEAKQVVHP